MGSLEDEIQGIAIIYVSVMGGSLAVIFGALYFIHRTDREHLHFSKWPMIIRWIFAASVYVFVIVPFLLIIISGIFGMIMAAIEGWSAVEGFEYVVSNTAGLSNPLTQSVPDTVVGDLLDLYISTVALLLVTTTMGIASSLSVIGGAAASMPQTVFGLIRYMVLYIPVTVFASAAVSGAAIAALEDWSFWDGFLFMSSSLCGLANPLTNVVPTTALGAFVEVIIVAAEVCLGGAILGTLGAHPVMPMVVAFLEGETLEEVMNEKAKVLAKQFSSVRGEKSSEEEDWMSMDKEELIRELRTLGSRNKELSQSVHELSLERSQLEADSKTRPGSNSGETSV